MGVRLAFLALQLKYCSYTGPNASYYSDLQYNTWEIKKSVNHEFSNELSAKRSQISRYLKGISTGSLSNVPINEK